MAPKEAWVQELTAQLPEARAIERLTRAHGPRLQRAITWELLSDSDRDPRR